MASDASLVDLQIKKKKNHASINTNQFKEKRNLILIHNRKTHTRVSNSADLNLKPERVKSTV